MKKFFSFLLLAALFMCSCTVSEPEMEGDPSKVRLVAVKSMGVTLISVNYDNQGRITKINSGNELIYEISYDGVSSAPSKIVCDEYDTFYVNDRDVRQLVSQAVWDNIQVNSAGYITGCSVSETDWYYETEYDHDTGKARLVQHSADHDSYAISASYSNGHMTKFEDDEDVKVYNWQGDLLTSVFDGTTLNFTYSNVENVCLQWDPNNEVFGPIAITGFFGKAPSRFVKTAEYDSEYGERIQYSYALLDNGLINMCRVLDSYEYDFEPVLNFIYEKVK